MQRGLQALEDVLRQPLALRVEAEDVLAEGIAAGGGEIGGAERGAVGVHCAAVTFCWRVLAIGVRGPPVLLECVPMQHRGYVDGGRPTLATGRNITPTGSP